MLHFLSFMRAIGWIVIGTVFGLASICIFVFASTFFNQDFHDPHNISNSEAVIFLCLALKSGAGADFLFSEISTWVGRILAMVFVVIALFFVGFIFNPNNLYEPSEETITMIAIIYSMVTIIYCVALKWVIFYRERITNKALRELKIELEECQKSKPKKRK